MLLAMITKGNVQNNGIRKSSKLLAEGSGFELIFQCENNDLTAVKLLNKLYIKRSNTDDKGCQGLQFNNTAY